MATGLVEAGMAKKTTPVRVADDALKLARIASSYTGESVVDYISRVITEHSQSDIERLHDAMMKPKPKGKDTK